MLRRGTIADQCQLAASWASLSVREANFGTSNAIARGILRKGTFLSDANPASLDPGRSTVAANSLASPPPELTDLHVKGAPGSFRELLSIAVPMILSSGTQSMMHVIDRIFLTWYSESAVAAALPAGILFWSCLSFPFGVISYANAFVAQYDGARQPHRVSSSVWQAVYFALVFGLLLLIPTVASEAVFTFIGHGDTVQKLEVEYFTWLCYGGLPAMVAAALACFYSGRGQTMVVFLVNAAAMLVNVVLDYAMIFGHWGFAERGMSGAALATNLANVFAAVSFLLLLMRRDARIGYHFWKHWRPDRILIRDLLRFGGPGGLQMFLDVAGFAAFMMIIGWIGQRELAATNIAFNLNTLAFIPVIGVGIAVSTLVGHRIGEGRPQIAEASVYKAFVLAGGIMIFFGVIYVLLPQVLLAPYEYGANSHPAGPTGESGEVADFAEVRSVVIVLLRFVAIYSFFDAMAIIFGSAIRAAGDTVFSMIVTFFCAWGLLVIPAYLSWTMLAESHRDWLLFLSWVWCSIYVTTLGFIYFFRFRQGKWKFMSVIEPESKFTQL